MYPISALDGNQGSMMGSVETYKLYLQGTSTTLGFEGT